MPCCVFRCPGGTKLVRFPTASHLRERWHEAIRVGTGAHRVPEDQLRAKALELCASHFARDPTENEAAYQEPSRFVDCSGKPMKVGSCRLCHRFGPESEMYSLKSKMATEFRISVILQQQSILKVVLDDSDFLQLICQECLVRVELIKTIQREFYYKNATFVTFLKKLPSLKVVQEKETPPVIDLLDEDSIVGFTIDKTNPLQQRWNVPDLQEAPQESPPPNAITKRKKRPREPLRTSKCYICKLQFHSREELAHHLAQSHVVKPRYACSECRTKTTRFKEITSYNVHLSWHDEGERPLKCRSCPVRFVTRRGRLGHERRVHSRTERRKKGDGLRRQIGRNKVMTKKGSRPRRTRLRA